MNYIIYDLEWNQPATPEDTVCEPVYLSGEIIEIGAVKLDEAFRLTDEFKVYISPKHYTKMHNAIAALTGIYDRDLQKNGLPFPEAFAKFMTWSGQDCIFMTWSMNDLPMLIDNMVLHGIDLSGLPPCCDIQRIFGREILRSETHYSLESAMAILKEHPDDAHDALNDARNTAKICNHLDLDRYLGEYTSAVFAEMPGQILYETKHALLAEEALQVFDCPWCGQRIQCEPWICFGRNTYFAYGICPEEDEFLVQLTAVHRDRRGFSANRIIFELSDDLWDLYMDRKELAVK